MDHDFNSYFLGILKQQFNAKVFRIIDKDLMCDMVYVPSKIFGNRLISLGYLTEGGIYGNASQDQSHLIKHIQNIMQKLPVDFIEFRGGIKPQIDNLMIRDHIYANFIQDFHNIDDILLSIPRKKRADIRKALSNPEFAFTDTVSVDDFYKIFADSQHRHGTPIHKKSFFQALNNNSSYNHIYGIKYKGQVIAACMVYFTQNQFIAYYGGSYPEYTKLHAYDLLYYHLMCLAKDKNMLFNFGRSKYHTGSFNYKKFWGFTPNETNHYIWLISDKPIPDIRANNPAYSRKIIIWRKLPRWLVNFIGPYIMQKIG